MKEREKEEPFRLRGRAVRTAGAAHGNGIEVTVVIASPTPPRLVSSGCTTSHCCLRWPCCGCGAAQWGSSRQGAYSTRCASATGTRLTCCRRGASIRWAPATFATPCRPARRFMGTAACLQSEPGMAAEGGLKSIAITHPKECRTSLRSCTYRRPCSNCLDAANMCWVERLSSNTECASENTYPAVLRVSIQMCDRARALQPPP